MKRLISIAALILSIGSISLAQATELHIYNPGEASVESTLTLYCQESTARSTSAPRTLETIPAKGTITVDVNDVGGAGPVVCSAVVEGQGPLAAVVYLPKDKDETNAAFPLDSQGYNTLGATNVQRDEYGASSTLAVINLGQDPAQITASYYDQDGVLTHQSSVETLPGYPTLFSAADQSALPTGFQGSAMITSDQPLAGIKYEDSPSGETTSIPSPDTAVPLDGGLYIAGLPVVQNVNEGAHTTISQTNVSAEDALTTAAVYKTESGSMAGYQIFSSTPFSPYGLRQYDPAMAEGLAAFSSYSASVENSGSSYSLLQVVNAETTYDSNVSAYSAVTADTTIYVPGIKTSSQGECHLDLYNASDIATPYSVTFYDAQGNQAVAPVSNTMNYGGSVNFQLNSILGTDFQGSATITSDQPLTAVVNYSGNDGAYAYSGVGENAGPNQTRTAGSTLYAPYLLKNPDYTGWWWEGQDFTGTGISVENQNDRIYLAWYGYDDTGRAEWYSALLASSGTDYSGVLYRYTGWPLAENTPGDGYLAVAMGPMSLDFTDTGHGTLSFTIDETEYTKTLSRYWTGTTDSRALNGWWYDPAYDGMGVYLEIRDGTLFGAWYHYRDDTSPRWWICLGDFPEGSTVYNGPWGEFSSGQTLTGAYQAATYVGEQGDMSLNFADDSHATMSWGGNIYNLERFSFGGIGQ